MIGSLFVAAHCCTGQPHETFVPQGVCHGTTTRTCSEFKTPETCLLMGCQAVLPGHTGNSTPYPQMCSCRSCMKDCGEFVTHFECEYLAACEWVYDSSVDTSISDCPTEVGDIHQTSSSASASDQNSLYRITLLPALSLKAMHWGPLGWYPLLSSAQLLVSWRGW